MTEPVRKPQAKDRARATISRHVDPPSDLPRAARGLRVRRPPGEARSDRAHHDGPAARRRIGGRAGEARPGRARAVAEGQARHAAERAHLLRPAARQAGEARVPVARGQRGLGAGGRRPARARALRRAHGVQRHEAVPEARRSSTTSRRSACGSAPTSTRTRPSTRPSTSSTVPTDDKAFVAQGPRHPARLGRRRHVRAGRGRQGARRRARGVAARARRVAAPVRQAAPRCCSRARATPSGCTIGLPEILKKRAARRARPLLQGLVPARPDGGDRRR